MSDLVRNVVEEGAIPKDATSKGDWEVVGYDTFDREFYPLYDCVSEEVALALGIRYLKHLEATQPAAFSGGQAALGIQDRVFIIRPDGTQYRLMVSE